MTHVCIHNNNMRACRMLNTVDISLGVKGFGTVPNPSLPERGRNTILSFPYCQGFNKSLNNDSSSNSQYETPLVTAFCNCFATSRVPSGEASSITIISNKIFLIL